MIVFGATTSEAVGDIGSWSISDNRQGEPIYYFNIFSFSLLLYLFFYDAHICVTPTHPCASLPTHTSASPSLAHGCVTILDYLFMFPVLPLPSLYFTATLISLFNTLKLIVESSPSKPFEPSRHLPM